jgi:hypothetical protein
MHYRGDARTHSHAADRARARTIRRNVRSARRGRRAVSSFSPRFVRRWHPLGRAYQVSLSLLLISDCIRPAIAGGLLGSAG